MKINIDKRKLRVEESILKAVDTKLNKLDSFFYEDAEADIKFSEVRGRTVVEVTVQSGHMVFRAENRAGDAYAAMDNAIDSIVRQIRKNKTRLGKRLRDGAFERTVTAPDFEEDEFDVIRRKVFVLKPMSEEEAILQMEMLNHMFYLFKNADADNRVCVVYKRDDGGYGIIEAY